MEEVKNINLEEDVEKKEKDKKNSFTLIYILVGLFLIAFIGIMAYTFIAFISNFCLISLKEKQ